MDNNGRQPTKNAAHKDILGKKDIIYNVISHSESDQNSFNGGQSLAASLSTQHLDVLGVLGLLAG